jgi:predicted ArsR family transcriptional regulator
MTTLARNRLDALAALGEPVRRKLYRAVVEAGYPLSRDDAATAVGIPRSTAALHLDRLAEAGLLTIENRRLSGRTGPGAGRPTKLYSPASDDLLASAPERHYELAGELLAAAAERADRDGVLVRAALAAEAHRAGTAIGAAHAPLEGALVACGYGPRDDGAGGILLENCPFHALAERHTQLICSANVELVRGMAVASGDDREVALEPRAGHCCVAIHASSTA